MPKEESDEYLETIYDIAGKGGVAKTTDISERLKVKPSSVTEALQRLARKRMVDYRPYRGVSLTDRGYRSTSRLKRKHRLIEVFLERVLHIRPRRIHEEACKIEHSLSDRIENTLCRTLRGPKQCPHGSDIPPCSINVGSCMECLSGNDAVLSGKSVRKKGLVPLTSLLPRQKSKIAFIRGGHGVVKRLADLGLTPQTAVLLIRAAPLGGPVEIRVRGSDIVIGRGIAERIFVE